MIAVETKVNTSANPASRLAEQINPRDSQFSQTEHQESGLKRSGGGSIDLKTASRTLSNEAINRYLLLIARLENGVVNGNISNQELRSILSKLAQRVKQFTAREMQLIEKSEEYQSFKQVSGSFQTKLEENLKTTEGQQNVFKLLKSKLFVSLIKGDPPLAMVYHKSSNGGHINPGASSQPQARNLSLYKVLNSGYQINRTAIAG